jgi:hypothetical protein
MSATKELTSNQELLNWIDASAGADDGIEYLIQYVRTDGSLAVWPGYFDSEDECWRTADCKKVTPLRVAEMPIGPAND